MSEKTGGYRWYVLGVLVGVYTLHHLDRMVFSLLQEPIKHEFQLSDSGLAVISGAAYAISFGIAGLPLGYLSDRTHRIRLLATLIGLWSGLTALGAVANSAWHLFLVRVGVGAAESGSTPTNLSLIGDYFRDKRSTAIGIYMMGPQIGTLVGFALTGFIAAHYGWRPALLFAGLPGLCLMMLVLLTIREPPRQVVQAPSPAGAVRAILANPPLVHLIIATTIANTVSAGVSIWVPSLLIRSGGMNIGLVGLAIGLTAAPLGILGTILAGMLTDRLATRRPETMARLMAGLACLYIPAVLLAVATANPWIMIAGNAAHVFIHMFVNTPGYAMTLGMVPAQLRGTTAALHQVLSNLIGWSVGPIVGGALSDYFQPYVGAASLRYALGIFVFVILWAALHQLWAAALLSHQRKADHATSDVTA